MLNLDYHINACGFKGALGFRLKTLKYLRCLTSFEIGNANLIQSLLTSPSPLSSYQLEITQTNFSPFEAGEVYDSLKRH